MKHVTSLAVGAVCLFGWATGSVSATTIQFDYTFDTAGFFASGSQARASLQAAALAFESVTTDSLAAIVPGGGNTWWADFNDPSTGLPTTVSGLVVPADTLLIFVGTRDLTGAAIGSAGPGGFSASGTAAWGSTVSTRGQGNTSGGSADDFGPWGGTIAIDDTVTWNPAHTAAPQAGENDLFSVLLHEMGHVFGVGTADSWFSQISGSTFAGAAASSIHGGPVPLAGDNAHWQNGVTSNILGTLNDQEAAFDPSINVGTRKLLTELDVAGLGDIGWQVVPEPSSGFLAVLGVLALLRVRR